MVSNHNPFSEVNLCYWIVPFLLTINNALWCVVPQSHTRPLRAATQCLVGPGHGSRSECLEKLSFSSYFYFFVLVRNYKYLMILFYMMGCVNIYLIFQESYLEYWCLSCFGMKAISTTSSCQLEEQIIYFFQNQGL